MKIAIGDAVHKKSNKPFADGKRIAEVVDFCKIPLPNAKHAGAGFHVVDAARLKGIINPIAIDLLVRDWSYDDYVTDKITGGLE